MINKHSKGIKRREFIFTSTKVAASAMFLTYGGSKLLAAINPFQNDINIKAIELNNGVKMPMLGFGTYPLRDATCERCVAEAISLGYRLLDTATIYGNEESVGAGIKKSGIKREELFITSKLWVDDAGYENTKKAFELSLKKLGVNYLDLYLIHRPKGDIKGSWKAMEELYKEGKIRAIGVSNFERIHLEELLADAEIKPTINQIETHAFFQQNESKADLNEFGIQMEAWAPFAEGRNGLFSNNTLAEIGKKHNKTNAQVSLRWHFQRGIVSIPRTTQKVHMIENLDIFDFELTELEMQTISALDLNKTQFPEWG